MDGILYSAIGAEFFAEALASARSSLRFNAVPHLIVTDQRREVPDAQIGVKAIRRGHNPYADKIRSIASSPFERTIYIDTDTYLLDEILHLFELLDRFDIAACHSPGYRSLADPDVPNGFYELNTGLIVLRRNPATDAFLSDWLATYEKWVADPPFEHAGRLDGYADQPAFRRCLWQHRLQLCVLGHEYCFRTTQCAQVADRVRVLHGRHRDFERVAEIVNRERRARVFPRGTFAGM